MPSASLKARTLELLDKSEMPLQVIADEVGMTCTWVRLFSQRRIRSPNVDATQRLYEFLSKEPLFKDR